MSFIGAYLTERPVMVTRPDGGQLFVIAWAGHPTGISFADDGVLDPYGSGHPPYHYVAGEVVDEDGVLVCDGHRFSEVTDPKLILQWHRMMQGQDIEALRKETTQKLRDEILNRLILETSPE